MTCCIMSGSEKSLTKKSSFCSFRAAAMLGKSFSKSSIKVLRSLFLYRAQTRSLGRALFADALSVISIRWGYRQFVALLVQGSFPLPIRGVSLWTGAVVNTAYFELVRFMAVKANALYDYGSKTKAIPHRKKCQIPPSVI